MARLAAPTPKLARASAFSTIQNDPAMPSVHASQDGDAEFWIDIGGSPLANSADHRDRQRIASSAA